MNRVRFDEFGDRVGQPTTIRDQKEHTMRFEEAGRNATEGRRVGRGILGASLVAGAAFGLSRLFRSRKQKEADKTK